MKNRLLPLVLMSVTLVTAVVFTGISIWQYGQDEARLELARLGQEDVARRVTHSVRNLKLVRKLNDAVALSRARALARIVEADPGVLAESNRKQFDSLAADFGVDELHVTDGRGVLVRSFPRIYEGYDMAGSQQSAAFLPAITNRLFELAQEPMPKGLAVGDKDSMLFQYAGVARLDCPGIVQVGMRAERLAEAMRLSDVEVIARTTRIGRDGRVEIRPLTDEKSPETTGFRTVREKSGIALAVLESECDGYLIRVTVPISGSLLAEPRILNLMFVLDCILLILLFLSLPSTGQALVREWQQIRAQMTFSGKWSVSFRRVMFSPLSIMSLAVFVVLILVLAWFAAQDARRESEEVLARVADDMTRELDDCVDNQLEYIGQALCDRYGNPQAMINVDLRQFMELYAVDEINIVDGDGVCRASTVDVIVGQDQRSLANPAMFCKALIDDGRASFSQPFRQSASEFEVYRKYVGVAFPPPAKGYIQIGFDRIRIKDDFDFGFRNTAHDWHIGERGFFVLSKTANGSVLSSGRSQYDGRTLAEIGFDVFSARVHQNGERRDAQTRELQGLDVRYFIAEFEGEKFLCTSGVVNQFIRYTAAIPLSEVYGPAVRIVSTTAGVLFLVMIIVVVFMTSLSDKHQALQAFIAKDREQRMKDMTIAATVQASSLPVVFPDEPGWRIYATMDTAREVGGDFYDFYTVPSGRIFVLVADVSGKGIPAAMFMMQAKAIIRSSMFAIADFGAAVAEANARLAERNDANMFVTAWFGALDLKTGELEFVNAGHNPPLVKRADGSVAWIRTRPGLALAVMEGAKYRSERVRLNPGDSLFLYTDGVTEAQNEQGEFFGEARLEATLKDSGTEFVEFCRSVLRSFVGSAEQSDDITMLALDIKPQTEQKDM